MTGTAYAGPLLSAIEAVQRAAVSDSAAVALERGKRLEAGLTFGNLARLVSDGLLSLLASALILAVVAVVTAIACLAYVLVSRASGPRCPMCSARTSQVGDTVEELGGGLLHQELLYYCPGCRTISQEDVVLGLTDNLSGV